MANLVEINYKPLEGVHMLGRIKLPEVRAQAACPHMREVSQKAWRGWC